MNFGVGLQSAIYCRRRMDLVMMLAQECLITALQVGGVPSVPPVDEGGKLARPGDQK
jgi:hypothetical protein